MENGWYLRYPFTVYTYDSVDSTNSVAMRAVSMRGKDMDMSVHVAGEQTNGRGRNGRTWLNTEDAVMMSIVVKTKLSMEKMPMLNLAAAMAVKKAMEKLTDGVVRLSIKWPNDVMTADRLEKVSGILSELLSLDGNRYAVIGIGVNLNSTSVPEGLLQPASSIFMRWGTYINVLAAVNAILDSFTEQYKLLMEDTEAFLKDFAAECISVGRHVKVDDGVRVRCGIGLRLEKNGQLTVKYEDGTTDVVYAADVSIRNLTAVDERLALRILPKRPPTGNKGTFGRAAMIVGSLDMPGAALMSVKACLRSGAGLTRVLIPEKLKPSFALIPEAMLMTDDNKADELTAWATALGIGCGMGVSERTYGLLKKVLESQKPCVIDADALNTLAEHRELFKLLHEKVILTPHPAEMARLIGRDTEEVVKSLTQTALDFALEHGCCVLLKSNSSVIASPKGELRYNDSGSTALAKGGSGDVLTGIITAMLAQKAKPFDAAALGSYILGTSAEKALDCLHTRFVTAADVIDIIASEINYGG